MKANRALNKLLSVVVPAFKQGKTIKTDLENIESSLKEGLSEYDYELICVVDGIEDDNITWDEAQRVRSPKVKVIGYKKNTGKGYAVRYGMSAAKGELISFLDAGRDISPRGIMMLMAHMDWYNADIIVGSKRHPVSRVNYPFLRHILSIGYHFGLKILFGLPLTDTQSGIKIFKRKVIKTILPLLIVQRYAMDIEMLAVARHLGFKRIYEAPIEVTFDKTTSQIKWVGANSPLKVLWDTLGIFFRLKILHYYDK